MGIFVTCLGFGMGNYKDDMMETIAKNGNGGFYYIDSESEARKVFEEDLAKTLYVVSKDTKTRLEELAQATGRTKAFLANDAIEKYLETEAWQISAIQAGLKDVDNNNVVNYEEIKKKWEIE